MANDREQLIELRSAIIREKMAGFSESEVNRVLKNLHRMEFSDHDDFMSYVNETAEISESETSKATDTELDEIMGHMGFGAAIVKASKAQPKDDLDDVFKLLRI